MVSQNQDGMGWDGNGSPSRTGSLLSLDGRQRPAPAKTPPSYYDAVRSRHSLSQSRPSEGGKQDKGHSGQQVKYNSLPRPLPQRYPPTSANGQPHRPWPDDHYDPAARANGNQNWRPGDPAPRQLYDSPPKPANHVPLQLQVHNNQERYLVKRGPEQTESCSAPGLGPPRANEQPRINGGPRADNRLTVDCGARGNPMDMMRKESIRNLPPCPDSRSPPPAIPPGGRVMHSRVPPSHGDRSTNSLPRRDPNQSSGLLRRCYTMTPDGSAMVSPNNYPARPPVNGINYEPRYSKSGKLCPRPLSQGFESRPMPPPAIQLRTGPLGSYPDAETLKRLEMSTHNRSFDDFDRQVPKTSHGDMSQQIYVETNSFANGQSAITDHLAIPYRIPQVSPQNARPPLYESCNGMDGRKEMSPGISSRGQPSPSVNGIKGLKNQPLSACPRPVEDHSGSADHRSRRQNNAMQYSDNIQNYNNPNIHGFNKHLPSPDSKRNHHHALMNDNNAIYANHQMSFHSPGLNEHNPDLRCSQKRSPSMPNGNGSFYGNQLPKSCNRDIQNMPHDDDNAVYANQQVANARYKSSPHSNQQENLHPSSSIQSDCENSFSNFRSSQNSQKNPHFPPPIAQKPRPTLPQPSEMIMVTETRGWNGQANSYPKDVVKPTPRMPRFASIASGTHLATVPAYQCVINELSNQNTQSLPHSSDSSTLSLRSGYDSSCSSVRDYGRQPSKSDSSIDMRKLLEGGLKSAGSQQRIDKTFLSASMTSLCSDTSSSVSTRRNRYHQEDSNWERMNEEFHKRKDKGSVFSASPWEREEKEKLQREQLIDARRARDQEIALLESMADRNEKQEEWLRILRLEREFQRRAEQEMKEDEDDDEDDEDEIEKHPVRGEEQAMVGNFHSDKNSVPNERLGLKLLDELLENSSKSPATEKENLKSPSEKHFIPLEHAVLERNLQSSSLTTGVPISNQILDAKYSENNSRLSKPPIPAPRPSKATIMLKLDKNINDHYESFEDENDAQNGMDSKTMDLNIRNLSKIDISETSLYNNNESNIGRDYLQDNWLIEVNSYENGSVEDNSTANKHSGDQRDESRIYENIMEFQGQKRQHFSPQNGYGSHTLPNSRTGINHTEKKFPAMGVSSTLSRKLNGHVPCDADILPALYASSKVKSGYQREIPSELEDKSPEFKKLWISRPEKLTFQDKIRKFSLQAGEDDVPRDRVKNSRAQREIEIKFNEGQRKVASTSGT